MSELHHECGVAAIYHLKSDSVSPICPNGNTNHAARLIPRMLLDMQNRGQLSAGLSRYHPNPKNKQLIDTYRELGSVQEVFRLSHSGKSHNLMKKYSGPAAIGHVRYATCGKDDKSYAQPFENHAFDRRRWLSFGFNGQLANYRQLSEEILARKNHYMVRDTDTEILLHEIVKQFQAEPDCSLNELMRAVSQRLDGAYSLAMLNANGEMLVARDPMGIKPMVYAIQGPMFAAASESVALLNLGFDRQEIKSLPAGHSITISGDDIQIQSFADSANKAHCFFEWIYFANVASSIDDRSVYMARTELGRELADMERAEGLFDFEDGNTIVVPVPDTSKAAADSMAFHLGIPSLEGLIRNRYSGRTFIESSQVQRAAKAKIKYTPLREVLEGKRIILVEDSIVRSTTMKALLQRVKDEGRASEIHVRVACPPIMAPCFYGIDMSSVQQLFGPRFFSVDEPLTIEVQNKMAAELHCDSLRYLPVDSLARAIKKPASDLCQACVTGKYPTPAGQQLYKIDQQSSIANGEKKDADFRMYESVEAKQI